jgi:nucleotide-binding universal stress UspA family protein
MLRASQAGRLLFSAEDDFAFGILPAGRDRSAMRGDESVFKQILVPLDFTEKNVLALETACRLSDPSRGQLTLVHVIERIEHLTAMELRSFYKQLEARANREMALAEKRVANRSRTVRRIILFGRRGEEIVRYARKHKIDLIVMSSNPVKEGEGGDSWATVSHVVAVTAPCSTLLVK